MSIELPDSISIDTSLSIWVFHFSAEPADRLLRQRRLTAVPAGALDVTAPREPFPRPASLRLHGQRQRNCTSREKTKFQAHHRMELMLAVE